MAWTGGRRPTDQRYRPGRGGLLSQRLNRPPLLGVVTGKGPADVEHCSVAGPFSTREPAADVESGGTSPVTKPLAPLATKVTTGDTAVTLWVGSGRIRRRIVTPNG